MKRYFINIIASRDLMAISDYFYSFNIEAGEKFFRDFNQKCGQLAAFPNLGKSYTEIQLDLRGIPLANYIIFYRLIEDGVEIMRVVSGKRDLPSLFQDTEKDNF
jgi:toxin ParE1/3/4